MYKLFDQTPKTNKPNRKSKYMYEMPGTSDHKQKGLFTLWEYLYMNYFGYTMQTKEQYGKSKCMHEISATSDH